MFVVYSLHVGSLYFLYIFLLNFFFDPFLSEIDILFVLIGALYERSIKFGLRESSMFHLFI